MTQIDKFSIVQERTGLIRLLFLSRNKRKGKTIVRWQGDVQQENRYLLPLDSMCLMRHQNHEGIVVEKNATYI